MNTLVAAFLCACEIMGYPGTPDQVPVVQPVSQFMLMSQGIAAAYVPMYAIHDGSVAKTRGVLLLNPHNINKLVLVHEMAHRVQDLQGKLSPEARDEKQKKEKLELQADIVAGMAMSNPELKNCEFLREY